MIVTATEVNNLPWSERDLICPDWLGDHTMRIDSLRGHDVDEAVILTTPHASASLGVAVEAIGIALDDSEGYATWGLIHPALSVGDYTFESLRAAVDYARGIIGDLYGDAKEARA